MSYRIKKIIYPIGSDWNDYGSPEYITVFAVQVRNFLFWHTVKEFRKINKANELLDILKQ